MRYEEDIYWAPNPKPVGRVGMKRRRSRTTTTTTCGQQRDFWLTPVYLQTVIDLLDVTMFWRKQKRLKTLLAVRSLDWDQRFQARKVIFINQWCFKDRVAMFINQMNAFGWRDLRWRLCNCLLFLVLEEKNIFRDSWTLNHRFKVPWDWVWYVQVSLLGSVFQSGCMVALFRRAYEWACWISTTTAPENVSSWGGTECSTWKAITNLEKSQLGDFSISSSIRSWHTEFASWCL